jgi:hypothetical protein
VTVLFTGDGIRAVLGAPIALEHHAVRGRDRLWRTWFHHDRAGRPGPSGRLARSLAICATVLLALTTGCNAKEPYPSTPSTEAAQAQEQLDSLPSLEETTTQVQAAIDEITSAASKVIPGVVWIAATNAGEGNCEAPYEQTDGRRYFLPNQVAERVLVSEDQWIELLRVAKDAPGLHDVWFTGPAGVFIKFSYKGNMVVSGYTGCRLPS